MIHGALKWEDPHPAQRVACFLVERLATKAEGTAETPNTWGKAISAWEIMVKMSEHPLGQGIDSFRGIQALKKEGYIGVSDGGDIWVTDKMRDAYCAHIRAIYEPEAQVAEKGDSSFVVGLEAKAAGRSTGTGPRR